MDIFFCNFKRNTRSLTSLANNFILKVRKIDCFSTFAKVPCRLTWQVEKTDNRRRPCKFFFVPRLSHQLAVPSMDDEQLANCEGAKSQNSIQRLVFLRLLKQGGYGPSKPCLLLGGKKINSLNVEMAVMGHL